jgi:hypothetical protein
VKRSLKFGHPHRRTANHTIYRRHNSIYRRHYDRGEFKNTNKVREGTLMHPIGLSLLDVCKNNMSEEGSRNKRDRLEESTEDNAVIATSGKKAFFTTAWQC